MTSSAQQLANSETPEQLAVAVDQRAGARTAMFVSAACIFGGGAHPVRIRNISPEGALLEGPALPRERSRFRLLRGPLLVEARSMWTDGKQCGAVFLQPVDVSAWMARALPAHQQRVDAMVHQARLTMAEGAKEIAGGTGETPSANANLKAAITLLEDLEEGLSNDPLVIARHLDRLQSLDRALQLLRVAAGAPA